MTIAVKFFFCCGQFVKEQVFKKVFLIPDHSIFPLKKISSYSLDEFQIFPESVLKIPEAGEDKLCHGGRRFHLGVGHEISDTFIPFMAYSCDNGKCCVGNGFCHVIVVKAVHIRGSPPTSENDQQVEFLMV